MEKYGFVYIWFDRKHKRYYVGCHWGNENDSYICSSNWMRDAYRRRPNDFKRRIITRVFNNRQELIEVENKYLSLINDDELGKKYYNLTKHMNGHWTTNEEKLLSVGKKISKAKKGKTPNIRDRKEWAEKIRATNTGHEVSEETRLKISNSCKGKTHSEEMNRQKSERQMGRKRGPMSEEQKRKISETLKERNRNG
jgi:hypothetical protein